VVGDRRGKVEERVNVYAVFAQCTQYLHSVHLLEVGRNGIRKIYEDGILEFYVQQTRDRFGQWLIEFQLDSDITVLGVGRMTIRQAPVRCEVKEQHEIDVYIYISWIICSPEFECCMPHTLKGVLFPMTKNCS